jgi:chorismate mutase/prephenate dehydratase
MSSDEANDETSGATSGGLGNVRERIDEIDRKLLTLISERGELAQAIGALKAKDGTPVYAPDRESEILDRICKQNPGPFSNEVLLAVYRELMSGSFSLEKPLRIAFLGPLGSYSHLAATSKFGSAVDYEPVGDITAAFKEVENGHADFGVVPIENSMIGGIRETLDAFTESTVSVCAEINLRIQHNLLSRKPISEIERVYSKQEIFDQCRNWLAETGLIRKAEATASSSRAAEMASQEEGAAALGNKLAAELYDLPIQVSNVEDDAKNVTRFFVVGNEQAKPTGDDKTSILFTTAHKAGALVDVLNVLREAEVNLTMITSQPSRRNAWEYFFFIDAEGHSADEKIQRAVLAAESHCQKLRVIGSYPRPTVVT